ncbi:MAG TPA: hypothetical protein VMV95_00260 [Bacillota bacterium]|nr:hypothetical protein [Bacillota bacterium]
MVERTELERRVRRLIAGDITYRVLKSLGDRGDRRLKKRAAEIVDILDQKELNNRFFVGIEKTEEEKAKTLRQGINAFKKKYKREGEVLEGLIAEKRIEKNKNLVYGLNNGYHLSEEDYVQIMMDLGFEKREAASIYPHILAISERLGKADEYRKRTILIAKS